MKKVIRFIVAIIMMFSFISCDKKEEKIMLKGNFDNTSTIKIDEIALKNKIVNEESFIITFLLPTCSTCEVFKSNILNSCITKTHLVIYEIDLNDFSNDQEQYLNKPYVTQAPELIIYQNGKIKAHLKYSYEAKEFKDLESFEKYIQQYIIFPKLIEISETKLDEKIKNEEDFILYIGWNKCGDCQLLEKRILNSYLKNNSKNNVIYYLETNSYRSNLPNLESDWDKFSDDERKRVNEWVEFSNKYQFSFYRYGKVPTIQYYYHGETNQNQTIVYHNDVIKDGIVIQSYFPELVDQKMDESELIAYHDQKTTEFLNKYF